jgi:hypothetical protein
MKGSEVQAQLPSLAKSNTRSNKLMKVYSSNCIISIMFKLITKYKLRDYTAHGNVTLENCSDFH